MSFLSLLNVLKVTQKADQGRLTSKHGYGTVKIFKRTETEQYIPATHFQFKAEEDKNPQNGYIATKFARREAVNQFARADFESKGLIGAAVAYNQKHSVVQSFCQKNVKEYQYRCEYGIQRDRRRKDLQNLAQSLFKLFAS